MAMRSQSAPRRIYVRNGRPLVCYGGAYFQAPAKTESTMDIEKEVKIEVIEGAGGKKRVKVTQRKGKGTHSETWVQTSLNG